MSLTNEQLAVVEAPVEARLLVTAGPGTGKTHTLIARLTHLIDVAGLSPGNEVLVLSFSRAAVREIRRRLTSDNSGNAAYVRAMTFDSFATRFLAEILPAGGWVDEAYDGRIRMATEVIRRCYGQPENESGFPLGDVDCEAVRELLDVYRHILVDEVQDLVGERVELVKALLAVGGGFSLFGDPAQGIYTFLLAGPGKARGDRDLYDWVRRQFANALTEYTLSLTHRFETPSARRALWAGPILNAGEPAYTATSQRLQDTLARLTCAGDIEAVAEHITAMPGQTAVLTRTNGEALLISRKLRQLGVRHYYRHAATDRVLPRWIASVLKGIEHSRIGRSNFLERAGDVLARESLDPEEAWLRLKLLDGPPPDILDLSRISEAIRSGRVPDEMAEQEDANIVVSTIHRAKGLEFDNVIVVEHSRLGENDDVDAEGEARILYVALTRPKRLLLRMERLNTFGLRRSAVDGRWLRRYSSNRTTDFEIRADDIRREEPAGNFMLREKDVLELQRYLETEVAPDDPVTMTLLAASDTGDPWAHYAIRHHNRSIGVTTNFFGEVLHRGLMVRRGWRVSWPSRIEDLFVEGVDSVAGDPGTGRRCGLGAADVWLRVRVSGLGRLYYN